MISTLPIDVFRVVYRFLSPWDISTCTEVCRKLSNVHVRIRCLTSCGVYDLRESTVALTPLDNIPFDAPSLLAALQQPVGSNDDGDYDAYSNIHAVVYRGPNGKAGPGIHDKVRTEMLERVLHKVIPQLRCLHLSHFNIRPNTFFGSVGQELPSARCLRSLMLDGMMSWGDGGCLGFMEGLVRVGVTRLRYLHIDGDSFTETLGLPTAFKTLLINNPELQTLRLHSAKNLLCESGAVVIFTHLRELRTLELVDTYHFDGVAAVKNMKTSELRTLIFHYKRREVVYAQYRPCLAMHEEVLEKILRCSPHLTHVTITDVMVCSTTLLDLIPSLNLKNMRTWKVQVALKAFDETEMESLLMAYHSMPSLTVAGVDFFQDQYSYANSDNFLCPLQVNVLDLYLHAPGTEELLLYGVTPNDLYTVCDFKQLRTLKVNFQVEDLNGGLQSVFMSCKYLTDVTLVAVEITTYTFAVLGEYGFNVHRLDLTQSRFDEMGFVRFMSSRGSQLRHLVLSKTELKQSIMESIQFHCVNLRVLNVHRCYSQVALKSSFLSLFPRLPKLKVFHAPEIQQFDNEV
eukprot:PhF_6_TR36330/c0_g3_i6/m.53190